MGRFTVQWVLFLENIGYFIGLYLGGGSTLVNSAWGWLAIGSTLVIVCGVASLDRSTLKSRCAGLYGVGTVVYAAASGSPWCSVRWNISAIIFRAAVCLSPRDAKGAAGEGWRSLSMRSAAAADEEVAGIFTQQGVNLIVSLTRSALVDHIQVQKHL